MGIRKAKDALKKAQNESSGDRRLISKGAVRKKPAASGFTPSFPGQHRGY